MNRPRAQRLSSLLLLCGAIAAGLAVLEIGLRLLLPGGTLARWPNFVAEARTVHASREQARFVHDDRLGYVPRPGFRAAGVTFDDRGLRDTGERPPSARRVFLATGDSYTFGDEVDDGATWPAHLQRLTGRRTLNGGVSGYGFDQSVLRAEALAPDASPSAIVVGFIADDIRRTEMRRLWGAEKPYFDIDGDRLQLRNVPVPPRPEPASTLNFWQHTLGYSLLVDFVLRRLDLLHDWFGDHVRAHPAGTGERIACRLAARLAELQRTSRAPVFLLAQYDPMVWRDSAFAAEQRRLTAGLLDCARRAGVETLDSFEALAASRDDGGPAGLYGLWHLNDRGNRLTAELVAAALAAKGR